MLTNYFIVPHSALSTFVDNYTLLTSGKDSITFNSYWPASNETSLIFHLQDSPHHQNDFPDSTLEGKSNCVVGLLTRCNGIINFTGKHHTFIIQFKANGFNKIFRLPMCEFTDKVFAADDVFGKQAKHLQQQLLNAEDIFQMAQFADSFLLFFLNNKKTLINDGITAIARDLYNTTALLSVSEYAHQANMSIRNFERRFKEQAGISPKLYIKLVRFNEAIKIKTRKPDKSWTSITYECGYYDQMHLIKDFKQFTGLSPNDFLKRNKNLLETNIDIPQLNTITFDQPEEALVFVDRKF